MPIISDSQPIFPVVFQSPAGWVKEAINEDDLTESSKYDVFEEWIGGEIFDSGGNIHRVTSAKFSKPKGGFSLSLDFLLNFIQDGRYMELETKVEYSVDLQGFKTKLKAMYPGLEDDIESAENPEEVIRLLQ